jgi:hypothetical protein
MRPRRVTKRLREARNRRGAREVVLAACQGGARAVSPSEPQPQRTVSQILGAHAAAQMAAARDSDLARRSGEPAPVRMVKVQTASFTVSWAAAAMCIGFKKPAAG